MGHFYELSPADLRGATSNSSPTSARPETASRWSGRCAVKRVAAAARRYTDVITRSVASAGRRRSCRRTSPILPPSTAASVAFDPCGNRRRTVPDDVWRPCHVSGVSKIESPKAPRDSRQHRSPIVGNQPSAGSRRGRVATTLRRFSLSPGHIHSRGSPRPRASHTPNHLPEEDDAKAPP